MDRSKLFAAAAAAVAVAAGPAAAQLPGGGAGGVRVYGPSLLYAPGSTYGFGGPGWPQPYGSLPVRPGGVPAGYGAVPVAPAPAYRPLLPPALPVAPPAVAPAPATRVAPLPYPVAADPRPAATGLRVVMVTDGPARAAGLREGDVILSVGGARIRTYAAIRAELGRVAEGVTVDVAFVTAATGAVARRAVAVKGGRIGVTVEEVSVPGP